MTTKSRYLHETTFAALHGGDIKSRLLAGQVVVIRAIPAIAALRRVLHQRVRQAALRLGLPDDRAAREFDAFLETGEQPSIRAAAAMTRAIRSARTDRLVSACLAELAERLCLEAPILLDGGIPRLVLLQSVVEIARSRPDLFEPTDFERERPDGPTEIFMQADSAIHRDFNRPHDLFMCNLWFPLHDMAAGESVHIYPRAYREALHESENSPEARAVLGPAISPGLKAGDALLFHSEQLHGSPPRHVDRRRFSYDVRIASYCFDDNTHYRQGFFNLDNFRTADGFIPSAEAFEQGCAPSTAASIIARRGSPARNGKAAFQRLNQALEAFPFAEDRYLALVDRFFEVPDNSVRELLVAVGRQTRSYFYSYRCAELLAAMGATAESLTLLDKARTLADSIERERYCPVRYQTPRTQPDPADIPMQATALRSRLERGREAHDVDVASQ